MASFVPGFSTICPWPCSLWVPSSTICSPPPRRFGKGCSMPLSSIFLLVLFEEWSPSSAQRLTCIRHFSHLTPQVQLQHLDEFTFMQVVHLRFEMLDLCFNLNLDASFLVPHSGHIHFFNISSGSKSFTCGAACFVQSSPLAVTRFHSAAEPLYVNGFLCSFKLST